MILQVSRCLYLGKIKTKLTVPFKIVSAEDERVVDEIQLWGWWVGHNKAFTMGRVKIILGE